MRRIATIISFAPLVAACSATAEPTTTTTTTVAETTTTQPAAASTDTALSFETIAGTPPAVFESFFATMVVSMEFDETVFDITGEGTWDNGTFDCTVTTDVGGFEYTQGIIATPETLWFDAGDGYEESGLFTSGAQGVMATCPTSPLFWAEFAAQDIAALDGEQTTRNGRATIKADVTQMTGLTGGLGLVPGFEGAKMNEMTMWIDVETNAMVALRTDVELDEELLAAAGGGEAGTGPMKMVMEFSIDQLNSPSLSVREP
ncbi:MAG: hypothetical protein QNL12_12075 [Acidimicrobiia bacterium]|nr:hypothetical protein [Acidimicrobiia bacterium]